jgi:hypothetical protein
MVQCACRNNLYGKVDGIPFAGVRTNMDNMGMAVWLEE